MDDDSHVEPIPLRFWWLKRLSIAGGCVLLAMVLLVVVWNLEADRRLNTEIERARADGGPVLVADFDAELDAVPDADNAALLYQEAIAKLVATSTSGVSIQSLVDGSVRLGEKPADEDELLAANAEALRLVREARTLPAAAWSHRLEDAVATGNVLGSASGQRQLGKFLWFAAALHHERGNDAEALETVADFDALNRTTNAHPTILSTLVARATHDLNFCLLERFGSKLRIREHVSDSKAGAVAATRSQVEALIHMLLDETHARDAFVRALRGEQAYAIGMLDQTFDTTGMGVSGRLSSHVQRPVFVLDHVRAIRLGELGAEAAKEASWPDAEAQLPYDAGQRSLLRRLTRPMTDASYAYFGSQETGTRRFVVGHYRHLVRRRMAAIALAIRLYELDHERRPKTLAELVPKYLPHVPIDPFSPDGDAIRYRPQKGNALLYSVGVDGIDNNGVIERGPDRRLRRERSDVPFYLDGRPKPGSASAPTSQEAVDENADEQDE